MSKLKWLRTYLLTPILVPLRFILLILVVWIAWFVSFISLVGLSEDQILNHPMTGWRQTSKQISSFFGRLAFRYVCNYLIYFLFQLFVYIFRELIYNK